MPHPGEGNAAQYKHFGINLDILNFNFIDARFKLETLIEHDKAYTRMEEVFTKFHIFYGNRLQ